MGDDIEVIGRAPEEECRLEMFVAIRSGPRTLTVPFSQLAAVATDAATQQVVEGWHYWVKRGDKF